MGGTFREKMRKFSYLSFTKTFTKFYKTAYQAPGNLQVDITNALKSWFQQILSHTVYKIKL